MWLDAESDENGRDGDSETDDQWDLGDDNAYWRRRFFILGGGVAALAVCAWLLPAAHPADAKQSAATSRAAMAALAKSQALPSGAYGSAWVSPMPTVSAALAVHPKTPATAQPSLSAKSRPTGKPSPTAKSRQRKVSTSYHPSPSPSAAAQAKITGCAPADIVLSLFTSQPSYAATASPEFSVYAVSTASAACTLQYGPGSVHVVVTRHGHVVWDSAACKLAGDLAVRFTLGVPQVLSVTWNRAATKPSGCGGSLSADAVGTLEAVALGRAGESTPVHSFTVAKLPASSAEGRLQRVPHVFDFGDLHA